MHRTVSVLPVFFLVFVASCQQRSSPPATDTHRLIEEVHHKPEVARQMIADVVAEPHGVALVAEELSKSEIAAATVVDELMKHPAIAAAIADRCAATAITRQIDTAKGAKAAGVTGLSARAVAGVLAPAYEDFSTAASAFVTRSRRSFVDPPMQVSTHERISLSIREAAVWFSAAFTAAI